MTVLLSDCPLTVESVSRYRTTMKSVFVRVAVGSGALLIPDAART